MKSIELREKRKKRREELEVVNSLLGVFVSCVFVLCLCYRKLFNVCESI